MPSEKKVSVAIPMAPGLHDAIKSHAKKLNVSMSRYIQDCVIASMPEDEQTRLRVNLPHASRSAAASASINARYKKKNQPGCPKCKKQGEFMPNKGPWHDTECEEYYRRALGV